MPFESAGLAKSHARSIILFAYGQSNAEAYVVGPRPASDLLANERVVTLTTGNGIRGLKFAPDGSKLTGLGEFYENGRRLLAHQLEETHPVPRNETRNSSILHATGARLLNGNPYAHVYIRAFAKGGLRLAGAPHPTNTVTGIWKNHLGDVSPILIDLISTGRSYKDIAEKRGEAIDRAYILFIHGEADRSTPTEKYLESFSAAKTLIDDGLRGHGIEPHWLVTQTGGTDHAAGGNDWSSRLAADAFQSGRFEDLTFLGALYPYALHDHIHHDASAKALIGELAAIAINEIERGKTWTTPRLTEWHIKGDRTVVLDFTSDMPLIVDHTEKFTNLGFTLPEDRVSPNRIVYARQSGPFQIEVEFEASLTKKVKLGYAYRRKVPGMPLVERKVAFGGGQLRTTWQAQSEIIPGHTFRKWVPGFMIEVSGRDTR